MSENNNVMTTIKKNPLVIIGIVVVVVVGIVLIVKMRGSEESFSASNIFDDTFVDTFDTFDTFDTSAKIIENYPQSTPMNVMYSDASGNLGTTTDLGLQNLTVSGDSTFANNNVIINSGELSRPGAQTRINSQGIIFGGTNNGRESNSAQISAGKHDADALCIMGMSRPDGSNRRIHTWAEGGTTNEGPMTINGALTVVNRNILAELDAINNKISNIEQNYIVNGQNVQIQGRNGRLDNYGGRCNKGDSDRDTGIQCGGGHGGGYIDWRIHKI